jgi:hypothetical protein
MLTQAGLAVSWLKQETGMQLHWRDFLVILSLHTLQTSPATHSRDWASGPMLKIP